MEPKKTKKAHSGGARRKPHKRVMYCDVCKKNTRHNHSKQCIFCKFSRKGD